MEVDYYSKYLKYKEKYLKLKAQLGGVDDGYIKCFGDVAYCHEKNIECLHPCGRKECGCKGFIHDTNKICKCTHPLDDHYACD